MGAVLAYSISSAIYLTLMYLGYKWLMADENHPGINRAAILSIFFISVIAPAITPILNITMPTPVSDGITIGDISAERAGDTVGSGVPLTAINLITIYVIGIAVCMISRIRDIISLRKIISGGEHLYNVDSTLVITDDKTVPPFSWMNYIVINREDYEHHGLMMLLHESCHTELHHWIDLIIGQLIAIFQWYNPAAWLLCGELKSVHEYQADNCVLSAGVEPREYQMLLIKKAVGTRFLSLANSLNHSKLKKRVTMMYKSKSSTAGIRALVIVPALVAGWFISNVPAVASVTDSLSKAVFSDKNTENFANPQEPEEKKEVFQSVDKMPEYPGGVKALMDYMVKNIKYPAEAAKQKIQGRVVVSFIVTKEGKIESPELLRKVHPLLDAEAIRLINSLPDFIPGEVRGKKVNVRYTLPVTFHL